MGHESQPSINIEELAKQNPEAGNSLAGSLLAQNPVDSALPRPNLSGAQNILDNKIDKGAPLKIDGAQLVADTSKGSEKSAAGSKSDRELMEELMRAHDKFHEKYPTLPIKRDFEPFAPAPNTRPTDTTKPATPSLDQALQNRRTKLGNKVRAIETSNGEDANETKEHSGELAELKKLAKDQGVPLVVCITRSNEAPDDLPRPKQAGWKAQVTQSKDMEKIMTELAQKEYGNVLVVKMEACPSAEAVAHKELDWTLGKEGRRSAELVVAPQVMVFLPNGQHHIEKHKTTLDKVRQLVRNK